MPSPDSEPFTPHDAKWLRRAHTWLGVGPLALYTAFHGWVMYAALDSREAWVERVQRFRLDTWGRALVLGYVAAHGALGVRRFLQRRHALRRDASARDPWLQFQAVIGAIFFLFLSYHVVSLWAPGDASYASAREAYDQLWTSLGRPVTLGVYIVGISALAFHLGTGLARLAERATAMPRASRYAAGVLAFSLWLLQVQVVARLAIGESLVPALAPGAESAAPADLP